MDHARLWMVRGRVTGLGNVLRLEDVGEGFALDRRQASSHNGPCQTLDSARAGDRVREGFRLEGVGEGFALDSRGKPAPTMDHARR